MRKHAILAFYTYFLSEVTRFNGVLGLSGGVTGVTLKIAFDSSSKQAGSKTAYGGVADASAEKSERFTSPESLDMVHRLRRISDCVLVGRGTVDFDDCTLTVRRVPCDAQPTRVVFDPSLSLLKKKDDYKMLNDGHNVIIYHCCDTTSGLLSPAITLVDARSAECNKISPTFVVNDLQSRGIHHVMVEGGPLTALSFLKERAVDRAIIVQSPVIFKEPVPSHFDAAILTEAGLEKLGSFECGGDLIECWSLTGVEWPSGDDLRSWP
mmetsp:Transcript_2827/g.4434  ORF Transcript_2827/g.4434 Transcript_2827/m.4434 type:complete len:266 (+) Transcript_2827:69-866(+)